MKIINISRTNVKGQNVLSESLATRNHGYPMFISSKNRHTLHSFRLLILL